MNPQEYAKLVERMRAAQTRFFQTRDPTDLTEAKKLERKVGRAADDILYPPPPGLFDGLPPTEATT